jgi:hypothetical protein
MKTVDEYTAFKTGKDARVLFISTTSCVKCAPLRDELARLEENTDRYSFTVHEVKVDQVDDEELVEALFHDIQRFAQCTEVRYPSVFVFGNAGGEGMPGDDVPAGLQMAASGVWTSDERRAIKSVIGRCASAMLNLGEDF